MNRIDKLRLQIDACRAGSDDLYRPELADLARAVGLGGSAADSAVAREFDCAQRFDACVVSALHDVAVPPGLLEKLLTQASTAPAADQPAADQPADDQPAVLGGTIGAATRDAIAPADDAAVTIPSHERRMRRRWVLSLAASSLIAASVLVIGYWSWSVSPRRISAADLAADVSHWTDAVTRAGDWRTELPSEQLLRKYPVNDLQQGKHAVSQWQLFSTYRREQAVVYDLTLAGSKVSRLFVIATPHQYSVAPSPPPTPLSGMTGGLRASAWQRGGLLFVLVVGPDGPEPKHYLRQAPAA